MTKLPRTPTQRQALARRLTHGAFGGRSAVIAPVPSAPAARATKVAVPPAEIAQFSQYDTVTLTPASKVPSYTVKVGGLIDALSASLATAGSSSTVVTFYKNGVSIGTVTLAASDLVETDAITPVRVAVGDRITARVTTAGTGAAGLETWAPIAA